MNNLARYIQAKCSPSVGRDCRVPSVITGDTAGYGVCLYRKEGVISQ